MENNTTKSEMIKKRNASIEINKRLYRAGKISHLMHILSLKDHNYNDSVFCCCMGEVFSYLYDDIHYIQDELKGDSLMSWGEWNNKIFGMRGE
ncbi:hypothetical protein FNI55_06655 [Salmonella enterica subsp. diarizonae]|nr:hypothetical protein [Salmonella enterica subsp. diarizonae]